MICGQMSVMIRKFQSIHESDGGHDDFEEEISEPSSTKMDKEIQS